MSENLIDPRNIKIPKTKASAWELFWNQLNQFRDKKRADRLEFQSRFLRLNLSDGTSSLLNGDEIEVWARILFLSGVSVEKTEAALFSINLKAKELLAEVSEISIHENINAETIKKIARQAEVFSEIAKMEPHRLKLFARGVAWKIQNFLPDEMLYHDWRGLKIDKNPTVENAVFATLADPDTYKFFASRLQRRLRTPTKKRCPDRELIYATFEIARIWHSLGLPIRENEGSRFYMAAMCFLSVCNIKESNLERVIKRIKGAL